MYSSFPTTGSLCLLYALCVSPQVFAYQDHPVEIVEVTAPAIEISAGGSIEADTYYDAQQIEALGASTLEELLEELEPDVASVRGRQSGKPVVLVNGRRIASFVEIRSYPPEAVKGIEIYPEEVALRHGYRANQKVVNILLLSEFAATALRGNTKTPQENGGESVKVSADYLRLQFDQRLSVDLRVEHQNRILESERSVPERAQVIPFSLEGNLRSPDGGEIDAALSALAGETVTATTLPENAAAAPLSLAALVPFANNPVRSNTQDYRTLRPDRENVTTGLSYSHPLGELLLATVSGSYERTNENAYLGLPGYTRYIRADNAFSPFDDTVILNRLSSHTGPLQRDQHSDVYTLNGSLAATHSGWSWSWLTNVTLTQRETITDRNLQSATLPEDTNPFANLEQYLQLRTDRQDSEVRDYETHLVLNGTVGDLPHGPLSGALTGSFTRNEQRNTTSNTAADSTKRLTRNLAQARATLDAPLLNDESWGELSANLNASISHYSDFDQITTFGFGLNWKPSSTLRFLMTYSAEEGAPSISQLSDPQLLTSDLSVYDFVNDESVRATRISGGNPALQPDKRKVWRFGARLQPLEAHDLNLKLDWIDRTTDQPIDTFPSPSQEIEAAFPERFTRDSSGTLVAFDTRPINLHSEHTSEIRWGIRYTRPLYRAASSGAAGKNGAATQKGGKRRRAGQGRLVFALDHTWTVKDELVIAPGLEAIDYVGHNTQGRGRGGAEHELTARMNYYYRGKGLRMIAKWQDAISSVPNADGSSDLKQAELYTLNLTAFYLFTPVSKAAQRFNSLKGLRVSLSLDNIFNDKPKVRDSNGLAPAGMSGDELDPFGRTLKLEIRKLLK